MKLQNVKDVRKLFEVVDSCKGKVELVTGEGDRLNLKSKLSQYISLSGISSRTACRRSRRWRLSHTIRRMCRSSSISW